MIFENLQISVNLNVRNGVEGLGPGAVEVAPVLRDAVEVRHRAGRFYNYTNYRYKIIYYMIRTYDIHYIL